ncbi:MAG TPA: hypothetical protein VGO35_09515 [Gammaproteobacteria bacterium]|jgi:hypothetical protein|nr:hypothetical protein [Gammaproteobacteria bacterium]
MSHRYVCIALVLLAAPAYADAPPAAPTGLGRLAAILPGIWKTSGETYATQFTQAGKVNYVTVRDCWHEGTEFKCVFVVNNKLQLFGIYSWDSPNGIYHENQITVQGPSPVFNIYVKGDTWTYLQDGEDKEGKIYHTRLTKTYGSSTSVAITSEYSLDGKTWVLYEKATETRVAE